MSSFKRAVSMGWLVCGIACEAPPEPEASEPDPGQAEEKAKFAEPDAPIEPGERVPKRPAGSDPDEGPDPAAASTLVEALSRLAQRYGGGWMAASAAFEAEVTEAASQDYQLVLGSAHCYRVLGVAEASLEDLDLRLFDPNGVQVAQDEGSDRFPILGLSFPVCPERPGAYRLQAVAAKGSGRIRVQAFHGL